MIEKSIYGVYLIQNPPFNLKAHSKVLDNFWQLKTLLKNDEKCFLFDLKSSSRCQDI